MDERWIPITLKMPEEGMFFLAYGPGLGEFVNGPEIEICVWDGIDLWDEGGTERSDAKFTHWMPLPAVK